MTVVSRIPDMGRTGAIPILWMGNQFLREYIPCLRSSHWPVVVLRLNLEPNMKPVELEGMCLWSQCSSEE